MATDYTEILKHGITSHNRLAYFIQRNKIAPVKSQRLIVQLGDYMLGQSDGICFRCDLDLDALNIDHSNGQYHHHKCPKEASENTQLRYR